MFVQFIQCFDVTAQVSKSEVFFKQNTILLIYKFNCI